MNIDDKERLLRIENCVSEIKAHHERLEILTSSILDLYQKYDQGFNPKDGVVTRLKEFQTTCPRKEIKSIKRWVSSGALVLATGVILEIIKGLL